MDTYYELYQKRAGDTFVESSSAGPLEDLSLFTPGAPLPFNDSYTYVDLVLCGGLGVVHKIRDKDGTYHALKTIRSGYKENRAFVNLFTSEVRNYQKIPPHPNIVQTSDYFSYNGIPYLVMEYIDGQSLGDFSSRKTEGYNNKELLQAYIFSIAEGLKHAHSFGVLHKDLKPENILIDSKNGAVKIIDFGLGFSESSMTDDITAGTPAYSSPEHFGHGELREASDVYSFGLIVFELLAGHPPFALDDEDIVNLDNEKRTHYNFPEHLSSEERNFLSICLAIDPAKRFADFGAVLDGLRQMWGDYSIGINDSYAMNLQRAYFLFATEQWAECSKLFEELDNGIASVSFYAKWALALLRTGNIERAKNIINIAQANSGPGCNIREIENIKSIIDFYTEDKAEATEQFGSQAFREHNDGIRKNFAVTLGMIGRYKDAVAVFSELCEKPHCDAGFHYEYANMLFQNGAYNKAILQLEEAIRKNPFEANYYLLMLNAHQKIGTEFRTGTKDGKHWKEQGLNKAVNAHLIDLNDFLIFSTEETAEQLLLKYPGNPEIEKWISIKYPDKFPFLEKQQSNELLYDPYTVWQEIDKFLGKPDYKEVERLIALMPKDSSDYYFYSAYLIQHRLGIFSFQGNPPALSLSNEILKLKELARDPGKIVVYEVKKMGETIFHEYFDCLRMYLEQNEKVAEEFGQSLELYKKAILCDEYNVNAIIKAVSLSLLIEDHAVSRVYIEEMTEKHNQSAYLIYQFAQLTNCFTDLQDLSLELYRKAVHLEPEIAKDWLYSVYHAGNDEMGMEIEPLIDESERYIADYYRKLAYNSHSAATRKKFAYKVIELDPDPNMFLIIANSFKEENKILRAIEVLEEGLELFEGNYDLLSNLFKLYFQREDMPLIESLIQKQLSKYEDKAEGYYSVAKEILHTFEIELHKPKRVEYAYKYYKLACEADPKNAEYMKSLARHCSSYNKDVEAFELYKKAIEIDNNLHIGPAVNYGTVCIRLKKWNDVVSFMEEYKRRKGNDCLAVNVDLGRAYFELGEYGKSAEAYGKAEEQGSLVTVNLLFYAAACLAVKNHRLAERGRKILERVLEGKEDKIIIENSLLEVLERAKEPLADTYLAKAFLGKAKEAYKAGNFDQMDTFLEKSRNIVGDDPDMIFTLAVTHKELQRPDEAKDLVIRARDIDPENDKINAYLGLLFHEKGEYVKAIPFFFKALTADPKNIVYARNYAGALIHDGRNTETAQFISSLAEEMRHDTILRQILALAYYQLKLYEKAIPALKNAIRDNPDYHLGNRLLGECYFKLKEHSAAKDCFIKYLGHKKDPYVYNYLGIINYHKGDHEAAVECYTIALEMLPKEPQIIKNLELAQKELDKFLDSRMGG